MEAAGLAIGIIGLAGLFNTCLDAVDRIDSYRDFGSDIKALNVQVEAEKLRLEQWGVSLGIKNGKFTGLGHHEALDSPRVLAVANELLTQIREICMNVSAPEESSSRGGQQAPHLSRTLESKRKKVAWALRGRARHIAQVEKLSILVQHLYNLIPTKDAGGIGPHAGESTGQSIQESWSTELRQLLVKLEKETEAEVRRDVHGWLGRESPNDLYHDSVKKRLDGTCTWILQHPLFLDWLTPDFPIDSAKTLWINAPAGFGKTILCASVIAQLSTTLDTPVAYFFLSSNFVSRDDPFLAIRAWVAQIIGQDSTAFTFVREQWLDQHDSVASRATVVKLLGEVAEVIPRCTFVLDGLDECTWINDAGTGSQSVKGFLEDLWATLSTTHSRLLVVSRDEPEIRRAMNEMEGRSEIKISQGDVQSDVALYSRSIVDRKLAKKNETTKKDISEKMATQCNGQFLWLKMQEDSLRGWKNTKQLQDTIEQTPPGLKNLYERNLTRILRFAEPERDRALSLLRWTAFALRPLTVDELAEAALISEEYDDLAIEELPDEVDEDYVDEEIVGLCGSLLEVHIGPDELRYGSRTVHLTHFSVKEFLLDHMFAGSPTTSLKLRPLKGSPQHTLLAKLCLRYISYASVWEVSSDDDPELVERPFRAYAAEIWTEHAMLCKELDADLLELMKALFDEENPYWMTWRGWVTARLAKTLEEPRYAENAMFKRPLYTAARFGFIQLVPVLLKYDTPAEVTQSALWAACAKGHADVVELLLNANVDPYATTMNWTPLATAAGYGQAEVVKALLKQGVRTQSPSLSQWTPLLAASAHNHIEVVRLLMDHDGESSINQTGEGGWASLNFAAHNGHSEVAKLLLEHGADTEIANQDGWTSLISASSRGSTDIVECLLKHGADVHRQNKHGWRALSTAAENGHLAILEALLKHKADFEAVNGQGWTALNIAALHGHLPAVKLLASKGANIHQPNNDGWEPINEAAAAGHADIVEYLIGAGAHLSSLSQTSYTPVNTAINKSHFEIAEKLIRCGADFQIPDDQGRTPLYTAAWRGSISLVKLLLEKGADLSVTNSSGWTPFHEASASGHLDIVQLLLAKGAQVMTMGHQDWTPIQTAAYRGHLEVVEELLSHPHVDISTQNGEGWTTFNLACRGGNVDIVKILFKQPGCENLLNEANLAGWTPLNEAACLGHTEIIEYLISVGADVSIASSRGCTPFAAAAGNGHVDSVRAFLRAGVVVNPDAVSSLTSASCNGHKEVVRALLADVDFANEAISAALSYAALEGRSEIVEMLLSHGAKLSSTFDGWTPLASAASRGHCDVAKVLMNREGQLDKTSTLGFTPINIAARNGHTDVLKLLFEAGADLSIPDEEGWTPLGNSCRHGHLGVTRFLLEEAEVKVTSTTKPDITLLHCAAGNGHVEVVTYLFDRGADVDETDGLGWTALNYASKSGKLNLVRLLLERGADLTITNDDGWTPLNEATVAGHADVIALLLEKGADHTIASNTGFLPLYSAAKNDHVEAVRILVEAGADLEAKNSEGWTALCTAAFKEYIAVVKLLLEKGANTETITNDGRTALVVVAAQKRQDVAKVLLEAGADVAAVAKLGVKPLIAAYDKGWHEVVEVLLGRDDISAEDREELKTHRELAVSQPRQQDVEEEEDETSEEEHTSETEETDDVRIAAYAETA